MVSPDNKETMNTGIYGATMALVGGNSNNGTHVGTFYSNLNNTASNTNWNIDAGSSYHIGTTIKCTISSSPLGENQPDTGIC